MTTTSGTAATGRINAGLQCPECYGVRINVRQTRFEASPHGWLCEECGCLWSRPIVRAALSKAGGDR